MKTVVLVRHATAVKRSPEKTDFHRSLKKAGRKEADEMSRRLKALKVHPKLFVSSPANRAFETAEIFAERLGRPAKKIQKREEIYGGLTPQGFLELIRGLDDKYDSAVFFGHDPLFTDFARLLVPGFDQDMPKAGVLGVEADADSWRNVKPELAKKAFFFHPGDAADTKTRRKDIRKEIETRIEKAISEIIEEFRIPRDEELTHGMNKISAKLAKKLASRVEKEKPDRSPGVTTGQDEEERG
jgi:phosphohistidine phosphatase